MYLNMVRHGCAFKVALSVKNGRLLKAKIKKTTYFSSFYDLQKIRTPQLPVEHVSYISRIFQIFPRVACVQLTGLREC